MFLFFSGALKTGLNTAHALFLGPSKTLNEMRSAQESRYQAFSAMMTSLIIMSNKLVREDSIGAPKTYFLA
ncbi:hypothetical protein [Legionella bozemanae]|uniref:Uncharacterized protein n=1 Tax=Legionella bozemanae TaxID=447 RepID=A0A0W0RS25_LEGBO|nr:hypothetical protein [Legionella bozemanae]KTC73850.1 hypothetical protein Lboz_1744 [Legionella bozemanae]STO35284.1 Uncharacterised protein [Legionella bozemanae]